MEELFKKRQRLKAAKNEKSRIDLEEVEDLCVQYNFEKISEEISSINFDEGGFNSSHVLRLMKKLSPKCRAPTASKGNLVTSSKSIEAIAAETYKKRLENR